MKGERRGRGRRRREEEEEEAKQAKVWNFGFFVWKLNLSMDTWFRTLYLVYGLGLGTPKLISCRVELRRALILLDMCFEKGLVTS